MSQQFEWIVAADDELQRAAQLTEVYTRVYGSAPDGVSRAPGRINLIGEHTDYNGGFVLPLAIDRSVLVAYGAATKANTLEVYSLDYGQSDSFDPTTLTPPEGGLHGDWRDYVRGVAWALRAAGLTDVRGGRLAMAGNVPLGSGLSSSAALELAVTFALSALGGNTAPDAAWRVQAALAGQRAENQYVGANVGIMDQFIAALGAPDSALLIDCRSLAYEAIALGLDAADVAVVAVNSAVPHAHATGEYNVRRTQCEEAARIMADALGRPTDSQLRDFNLDNLAATRSLLSDVLYRRAHHVISENNRTTHAAERLQHGDLDAVGTLLYASHVSMRDDYEITIPEIDLLVELAQKTPGVIGSRMTGGGFGGCTVSLVPRNLLPTFAEHVVQPYRAQTGHNAEMFVCRAVAGASFIA